MERRRRLSKTNVYSGGWLAPSHVVNKGTWTHGGPLEAGSYIAFMASDAVFRTSDPEGLKAMHVSAYEPVWNSNMQRHFTLR